MEGEHQCIICLQDGADACAPCGLGGDEPMFHVQCLSAVEVVQGAGYRCPHCNVGCQAAGDDLMVEAVGLLVQWSLTSWLQNSQGFWRDKSTYFRVKDGLMQGVEEFRVEQAVVQETLGALSAALGGAAIESEHLNSLRTFRAFTDADNAETTVHVRRVAVVNAAGTVLIDGFVLSASRCRCSPRRRPRLHPVQA